MTPKFLKALLAAGLAAALVGCGGGSDTTMAPPDPSPVDPGPVDPPAPTPEQMMANIEAGKTAFDAALASAKEVTEDSSSSNEEMLEAYTDKKMAAETFLGILDNNGGNSVYHLEATEAYRTANTGITTTEMKIAQAEKEAMDLAERQEAERMAEETKMMEAGFAYDGIRAGQAFTRASYGAFMPNEISYTVGDTDIELMIDGDAEDLNAIHGWTGQTFTNEDGGITTTAYVYSKAGRPFGLSGDTPATANNGYFALDATSNGLTAGTAIGAVTGAAQVGSLMLRPYIEITQSVSGERTDVLDGRIVHVYNLASQVPDTPIPVRIEGSVMGVSGTFSCTPAANTSCGSINTDAGVILGLFSPLPAAGSPNFVETTDSAGGNWEFVPTDPTDEVDAYVSYGYWIRQDGDDWTIGSFHDYRGVESAKILDDAVADPVTVGILPTGDNAIAGSATYEGGAAGMYAMEGSEHGRFMADVELTARFGTDNDISGTIDNFMVGSDEKDWTVSLSGTDFNTNGMIEEGATTWTMNDVASDDAGEWMGEFRDFTNDAAATGSEAPATVTGVFSAYAPNAKMVGAFGTDLEE